jgi:hypothetical protein
MVPQHWAERDKAGPDGLERPGVLRTTGAAGLGGDQGPG